MLKTGGNSGKKNTIMKKSIIAVIAVFLFVPAFSQDISMVTITGNGNLESISFGLDENVKLNVNKEGQIIKWGFDRFQARGQENYQGILDTYVGRVEYYGQEDDAAYRGKIRFIGRTQLTYFASYENEAFQGKLKSIGTNFIEYYQPYENESYKGSIKSIGPLSVTWYSSFENEGLRGKLKSLGNTNIGYYSSFEDKAYRGKIKNIDGFNYTYYSSFEKYSSSMKTGASMQNAGSVRYYIRNY